MLTPTEITIRRNLNVSAAGGDDNLESVALAAIEHLKDWIRGGCRPGDPEVSWAARLLNPVVEKEASRRSTANTILRFRG